MDQQFGAGGFLEQLVRAHVIKVGVGVDDVLDREPLAVDQMEDVLGIVSRIDDDGFVGLLIIDDVAIHLQRPDDQSHERHDLRYLEALFIIIIKMDKLP